MRTDRSMWLLIFTAIFGVSGSIAIYLIVQGNLARLKDLQYLIGIAIVIGSLWYSYSQLKKIDNISEDEEKARHDKLIAALEGIREDLKK